MDADNMLDLNIACAEVCLRGQRKQLGYAAMKYIDTKHPNNVFDTALLVSYIFMLTEEEKRAILNTIPIKEKKNACITV